MLYRCAYMYVYDAWRRVPPCTYNYLRKNSMARKVAIANDLWRRNFFFQISRDVLDEMARAPSIFCARLYFGSPFIYRGRAYKYVYILCAHTYPEQILYTRREESLLLTREGIRITHLVPLYHRPTPHLHHYHRTRKRDIFYRRRIKIHFLRRKG